MGFEHATVVETGTDCRGRSNYHAITIMAINVRYVVGLSSLLSSIRRHNGFSAITFVLVDQSFWILAQ